MNTLKEVPHPGAIDHAIEVLRASFDHPEADEAIAGLMLLREQAAWAHHTPALLSDADAAADLAGAARPGAEPVDPRDVYIRELCRALDAALDFAGTVGGGSSWWDDVWSVHDAAVEAARCATSTTPPQASQPAVPGLTPIAHRKLDGLLADGYQITGYSIERTRDDIVKRGAVTCGGMVLWWHGDNPPPQASQPLTDEQIAQIASTPCAVVGSYVHTFARAIEAAHGIGAAQKGKP